MKEDLIKEYQPDQLLRTNREDISTLATGATVSLVGHAVGRGLQVAGQILLARFLGPAGFGLYSIGWTLLRILGLIAPLGLDNGVLMYGPRHWGKDVPRLRATILQALVVSFSFGGLLGVGLYLLAPWLSQSVFNKAELVPILRWFSPTFALFAGLRVAEATTRVSKRMRFTVLAEHVTQPVSNILLIVGFHILGLGLFGAVAAGVISFTLALGLALYYIYKLFPEIFRVPGDTPVLVWQLLRYGLPTSLAGAFGVLILWVDRLFIGSFLPAGDLGVYQAISQASLVFATILGAMNAIFAPMIASLYHQGHHQRLQELFRISTRWGIYLSLPIFLIIVFAPRELLTVVFGEEYARGTLPLVILSSSQLINIGTGAVNLLLILTGHQLRWFLLSGSMLGVNIVLNLILVPRIGFLGAAIATTISVCGLYILGLLLVRRILALWPYDHRYLKGLVATLLASIPLVMVQWMTVSSDIVRLGLIAVLSMGTFWGFLVVARLEDEDRAFIHMISARLSGKAASHPEPPDPEPGESSPEP